MSAQKSILSIYDVCGIQEYIFATSRLSENAGASAIVSRVLKEQLREALEAVAEVRGGRVIVKWWEAKDFQILQASDLLAEIVYIGGGNAVVAYQDRGVYDEVNQAFAQSLLKTSYTLSLATAYVDTDFLDYKKDREELEKRLERVKARQQRQRPMGALPIVAQEALTGLPVTQRYRYRGQEQDLSTLQALKRQAYEPIRHNAESVYQDGLAESVSFAVEMEDLVSQKGEDGFVAVVHIDGNDMSEIIRKAIKTSKGYQASVQEMRKLSQFIADSYHEIFADLVKLVEERVKGTPGAVLSFTPPFREEKQILPIRPIILDGDDVTFICNARLGVPLAALFLRRLAQKTKQEIPFSACAGVALVHSHFSFNLAYEIAEACCGNAKKTRLVEKNEGDEEACGYLDFHILRGAYVREIANLREEAVGNGEKLSRLMSRPYRVAPSPDREHRHSFDTLDKILERLPRPGLPEAEVRNRQGMWPRSRLKKLYQAYWLGQEQTESLLVESASRGYTLSSLMEEPSEEGARVRYKKFIYDALELMDLYERNIISSLADSPTEEGAR